ncbi:MAG: HAD hydrolase-like protein, partial [Daejeonella sp.]
YYLFANFIEFTETVPTGKELTDFLKTAYEHHGSENIFDKAKEAFNLDEKYRENFDKLHYTAILPLKLLLYKEVLTLLQDIVVDRKQIFLITNGKLEVQINKIRQTEWNGLEKYLKVFFAEEIKLKPESDVLDQVLKDNNIVRKDIMIIGNSSTDEEFAASCGVDYVPVSSFL